jgi:hypothetical protein
MSSGQIQLKVGMNKRRAKESLALSVRGGNGTWPGVQGQVMEGVEGGA